MPTLETPTIVVASHKSYWMPNDPLYLPVQVGAAGKPSIEGFQRDDEGDNISSDNNHYSELTGLYWAWKNLRDPSAIGLVHYRRHFAGNGDRGVMSGEEARAYLKKAPVVLPKRRRYYIETLESHYANTLDGTHFDLVRNALEELSPEYLDPYNAHVAKTSGHMFNMLLMDRSLLNEYCSWMFPVVREAEKHLDLSLIHI